MLSSRRIQKAFFFYRIKGSKRLIGLMALHLFGMYCQVGGSKRLIGLMALHLFGMYCQVEGSKRLIHFHIWYPTLHLLLAHVSSPISKIIHINSLISTIKKNKIISLFFNVGLNNFTNSLSSIFTFTSFYIYVVIFIHFNWLILKCFNRIKLLLLIWISYGLKNI